MPSANCISSTKDAIRLFDRDRDRKGLISNGCASHCSQGHTVLHNISMIHEHSIVHHVDHRLSMYSNSIFKNRSTKFSVSCPFTIREPREAVHDTSPNTMKRTIQGAERWPVQAVWRTAQHLYTAWLNTHCFLWLLCGGLRLPASATDHVKHCVHAIHCTGHAVK